MTIEVTSTSEEGYVTRSRVGDYELTVDATEADGPEPNGVLLADYASCFIPAFRVGGNKEGFDDLGRIDIDVEGDLDEDDDLTAVRFHILVEEDLDDDEFDAVVERAEDICHVHSALREGLHAEITGETGAF
ncbi:OsmC family protein [Halobacterium hubeiense]|uniref:OsmC family protein n=1 Tax=Halobacterium hubeiense TaxID=1407499 RepID=UPI003C74164C